MRMAALLALAGCLHREGQLVSSVQVMESTIPLEPGRYTIGEWAEAYGCDTLEKDFRIADLLYQARGSADGLVNVTIEQIQEVDIRVIWTTVVPLINSYCYRVQGQQVRVTDGGAP